MLQLYPTGKAGWLPSRRDLLKGAAFGLSSLAALADPNSVNGAMRSRPTARNCIFLFLCGGPSQPDLWDVKPNAPSGVRTTFQPIATNVPGITFTELIPKIALHADKLAIIRSMTHDDNGHGTAIARTLLGQLPAVRGTEFVSRSDHPGLGAILSHLSPHRGELPDWIILPRPFTTGGPPYKGQSGGFLGPRYDPLALNKEKKGSLSDHPVEVDALQFPGGMSSARLDERLEILRVLNRELAPLRETTAVGVMSQQTDAALQLLTSTAARRAFDLEAESPATRDRYGRNEYGQSLLLARRLVEAGVKVVNVFWTFFDDKGCQFNLWDNHGVEKDVCGIDGQLTGEAMLKHRYCCPSFDHSFSALLEDLQDRGLLDETIVAVAGEFGRTPKINKTAGRDHWAPCYTQLLAGGGVRGGQVYGESDAIGAYVKDSPVTPEDYFATIYRAFGVSPDSLIHDPLGRPVRITQGRVIEPLLSLG